MVEFVAVAKALKQDPVKGFARFARGQAHAARTEGRVTDEQLLAEVEDILRTMPPQASLLNSDPSSFQWLGRAVAVVAAWNPMRGPAAEGYAHMVQDGMGMAHDKGFNSLMVLLHQVQSDLRMKTVGPVSIAVGSGAVFHYFDSLRKLIEEASKDILFVDPYLDSDFVSRYLSHARRGVEIRLLTGIHKKWLDTLVPAAALFAKQRGAQVAIKTSDQLHDRYLIVDFARAYQSGASFKDGAKTASTVISQVTDAFEAVRKTYEDLWAKATVMPI